MSTDTDDLERRLAAVERTLTDGRGDEETAVADLPDRAAIDARLDEIESRLDAVETDLADLDAATQAVRGYVGGVRAVNRDVERRADAALAAVDRLERELDVDADGPGSAERRLDAAVEAARESADSDRPSPTSAAGDGGEASGLADVDADARDSSAAGDNAGDSPTAGDDADLPATGDDAENSLDADVDESLAARLRDAL